MGRGLLEGVNKGRKYGIIVGVTTRLSWMNNVVERTMLFIIVSTMLFIIVSTMLFIIVSTMLFIVVSTMLFEH